MNRGRRLAKVDDIPAAERPKVASSKGSQQHAPAKTAATSEPQIAHRVVLLAVLEDSLVMVCCTL